MTGSQSSETKINGKSEQIMDVELEELDVDESYQRGIKMSLVQSIANEWRDEACGMIIVSKRKNGRMFVVDGQHRMAAAKMIGKTHLPARIVEDHSPKQEAELRLQTNMKRNESAAERFKAQLIAEVPESVAILKIVRSFKAKLALEGIKEDSITAISAIEKLYRYDKGSTLRSVLATLHEADGELTPRNTSTRMLWATEWFLRHHAEELDRKALLTVLRQQKAAIKARGDLLAAQMGGARWINNYRAMIEMYNDRVAKKAQLEAFTRGYKSLEEPTVRKAD